MNEVCYNYREAMQRWSGRYEAIDLAMAEALNEADKAESSEAHKAFMCMHGLLKVRKRQAEIMVSELSYKARQQELDQ